MAKQQPTNLAEAKAIAAAPVATPDAGRVVSLAREIFLRRITGIAADGKTPAFWAGKAFDDAQTFWDEVDTRNT